MRNNHQSACPKGTPAAYNALNDTQDFITVMLIHVLILLMKLTKEIIYYCNTQKISPREVLPNSLDLKKNFFITNEQAHAHTASTRMKFLTVSNLNSVLQGIEKPRNS